MSGYDYAAFLAAVQAQRRTTPTGCFYCDVVLEATCGPAATRAAQTLCAVGSGFVVDAHHLVPKQVLKREFPRGAEVTWLEMENGEAIWRPVPKGGPETPAWMALDDLLMDRRNGVLLRRYCHDLVESRARSIPKALWPWQALEFVEQYGLGWYLDKMDDRRT